MNEAIVAFGEDALLVDLERFDQGQVGRGEPLGPGRLASTHHRAAALRARFPGRDLVVGAGTILLAGGPPFDLEAIESALERYVGADLPSRSHALEVVYDGPDLERLTVELGLSREALVGLHGGREYTAELVGFLPGFAYLGPLDARLVVPRLATPRRRVPASSVGVAGPFTGVYPFASPGGWNLLGRLVGPAPFDPGRDPPMLFAPGDRVRFAAVRGDASPLSVPWSEPLPSGFDERFARGAGPALTILVAPACATVQDAGRVGQLGRGLPPSGPLDPETHAAANLAVGNAPGAAAIEIPLGSLEVRARGDVLVSLDGAPAVNLADGERLRLPSEGRAVRYLAVAGAVDVPVVLGARATLLVAGVGGLDGRPLRRGDHLPVGREPRGKPSRGPGAPSASSGARDDQEALDVTIGPHLRRFPEGALDALVRGTFKVSGHGDRTGVRLEGPAIPRGAGGDLALPVPMVRGAVEVTTAGAPIVLGPDHPTTGGYPVLAVLDRASQARLARREPGAEVRFRLRS